MKRMSLNSQQATFMIISLSVVAAYLIYHSNTYTTILNEKTLKKQKKTLNIHFVSHTHDDVGWLKTVDQYFEGTNNTIQKACVNCILDTVIKELQKDPKRKFTYVEIAYFSRWWDKQTNEMKTQVRKMVENKQLSFANGGWCMHDEATTHFIGMIDQTTLGHDFLKREFDFIPRVTWQLDPFGHSATQSSLLGSEAGFDAIYFGRIDYQDLDRRQKTKNCEGIWDSSPNLNDTEIFWALTGSYNGNYGAPSGFCFDVNCDDEPIVGLPQDKLFERVLEFMKDVQIQQSMTRGNNVMLTMGSDFQYSEASVNFDNLDLLISVINDKKETYLSQLFPDHDDIKAFYSTPEMYTDYKYEEFREDKNGEMKFEVKTDDFFPYSDCEHCFWTGYFTSRPGLKRLERVGSSFLQVTRQIQAFFSNEIKGSESILVLEQAMGTVQHHDGVTGTSKQHVAYDYAKQVQSGINIAMSYVGDVIETLFNDVDGYGLSNVTFCQLLNESICELSQQITKSSKPAAPFYAVVYNPIPCFRGDIITIPVSGKGPYTVEKSVQDDHASNHRWEEVASTLMLNFRNEGNVRSSTFSLHFDSGVMGPISMTLYRIRKEEVQEASDRNYIDYYSPAQNFSVNNGKLQIDFDGGSMKRISRLDDGTSLEVSKEWGFYESFPEVNNDKPASGAYIFRPKTPHAKMVEMELDTSKTLVRKSSMLTEVHLHYKVSWLKEVIKLFKDKPYVDIDYTVGPIDISDGTGKEIVMRLNSNVKNDGVFYTDSNAREFMKRNRSKRSSWTFEEFEPVAGNYYPVNAAIFIEDENTSMTVLTDRSQGGSSLVDGSIELMVHRRILHDDSRGVDEPLNETSEIMPYPPYGDASRKGKGVIIAGTLRVLIGAGSSGAKLARSEMDNMFSPLHLFTANAGSQKRSTKAEYPKAKVALKEPFPENLQLITYKVTSVQDDTTTYLVRLGHKYASGESKEYSLPVEFDLSKLFRQDIVDVTETTLTGNSEKIKSKKSKKQWSSDSPYREDTPGSSKGKIIMIYPMQIRSLVVKVSRRRRFKDENIQSVA